MSRQTVQLEDKFFEIFIEESVLMDNVRNLAKQLNSDYKDLNPLFLVVLNGSFIFAADLMREITIPCEIAFIKLSSYEGLKSTGNVKELIGLNQSLSARNVIIVEDIVDTGTTLEVIWNTSKEQNPESLQVVTALYKPASYKKKMPVKYIGMEIPNDFVVGYGLDYKEIGRNLKSIYKLASP